MIEYLPRALIFSQTQLHEMLGETNSESDQQQKDTEF
jgi:hypothetical protein